MDRGIMIYTCVCIIMSYMYICDCMYMIVYIYNHIHIHSYNHIDNYGVWTYIIIYPSPWFDAKIFHGFMEDVWHHRITSPSASSACTACAGTRRWSSPAARHCCTVESNPGVSWCANHRYPEMPRGLKTISKYPATFLFLGWQSGNCWSLEEGWGISSSTLW